jgi:hypothetical protein
MRLRSPYPQGEEAASFRADVQELRALLINAGASVGLYKLRIQLTHSLKAARYQLLSLLSRKLVSKFATCTATPRAQSWPRACSPRNPFARRTCPGSATPCAACSLTPWWGPCTW